MINKTTYYLLTYSVRRRAFCRCTTTWWDVDTASYSSLDTASRNAFSRTSSGYLLCHTYYFLVS